MSEKLGQQIGAALGRCLVWLACVLGNGAITCIFLDKCGAELGLKSLSYETCVLLWVVGDSIVSHIAWAFRKSHS